MSLNNDFINLLTEKEYEFIKELLLEDEGNSIYACQLIGQKLQNNKEFLLCDVFSSIFYICCTAKFATRNECFKVSQIIYNFINVLDPLPSLLEHKDEDLAERVFITLCFFKHRFKSKYKNTHFSLNFYRKLCCDIFTKTCNTDIAGNIYKWEAFLQERFL